MGWSVCPGFPGQSSSSLVGNQHYQYLLFFLGSLVNTSSTTACSFLLRPPGSVVLSELCLHDVDSSCDLVVDRRRELCKTLAPFDSRTVILCGNRPLLHRHRWACSGFRVPGDTGCTSFMHLRLGGAGNKWSRISCYLGVQYRFLRVRSIGSSDLGGSRASTE